MHWLKIINIGITNILFLGTVGMITLVPGFAYFTLMHQRRILQYQSKFEYDGK
ncbi:MAG: hypothetical protein N2747_09730 [Chitinophagaceae bacterium]|nr:hypothetical protein [Chitinophagaceae bacterium]